MCESHSASLLPALLPFVLSSSLLETSLKSPVLLDRSISLTAPCSQLLSSTTSLASASLTSLSSHSGSTHLSDWSFAGTSLFIIPAASHPFFVPPHYLFPQIISPTYSLQGNNSSGIVLMLPSFHLETFYYSQQYQVPTACELFMILCIKPSGNNMCRFKLKMGFDDIATGGISQNSWAGMQPSLRPRKLSGLHGVF